MSSIIIDPDELEALRGQDDVVIVDLCQPGQYVTAHIPQARYLPYGLIVRSDMPRVGLLPYPSVFSRLMSNLGITAGSRVVAYDDEGGGCAARLLWTLNAFGHTNASLVDGGIHSWINEGHETADMPAPNPVTSDVEMHFNGNGVVDHDHILDSLNDDRAGILDARSAEEYQGKKRMAKRAGHIPGAKHFEWTDAMDRDNNMRILPADQLKERLDSLGLTPDKGIICYCQSHHRSAYSWVMLKHLGYEKVAGYPGSWSDWGNRSDSPIET